MSVFAANCLPNRKVSQNTPINWVLRLICVWFTEPKGPSTPKAPKNQTSNQSVDTSSGQTTGQTTGQTYQSPEYYSYNPNSFYDFMIDMSKYRLKQPSNKS